MSLLLAQSGDGFASWSSPVGVHEQYNILTVVGARGDGAGDKGDVVVACGGWVAADAGESEGVDLEGRLEGEECGG